MHRVMICSHPHSQATWSTCLYSFLYLRQWQMYWWYLYFSVRFFSIIVVSMGRCSLQYVWYFSFSGIWWTYICLLNNKGVVNKHLNKLFRKFKKTIIHIKEIFHCRMYIHFRTCYEKRKSRMGNQVVPHEISKIIWGLVPISCLSPLWLSTVPL